MNSKILIFLFLMLCGGVFAQTELTEEVIEPVEIQKNKNLLDTDSLLKKTNIRTDNPIFPKKFEENFQKKYETEDFDYSASQPKTSLWERIGKALERFWTFIFGDIDMMKTNDIWTKIVKISSIIGIGVALYFLLRFLLGKDGSWIFGKKNKKIIIENTDIVENIHEIDFPQTIARYEREQDFRSAVRYQFLFMLKKLTDQKRIEWNPEKTNRDYISEIGKSDLQQTFKTAAYIFDYVWYGEFGIDQTTYEKYKNEAFDF